MALRQLLSNLSDPSTPTDSSAYPTQANHLEAVTFNQRSFRFGEGTAYDQRSGDRGGFSREPFIGNPRALLGSRNQSIPEAEGTADDIKNTLGFIDGVTDGLVRGGLLTTLQRSTTDFTRLTNFYLSNRGIGFLVKQVALQATNPAIEDRPSSTDYLGLRRNRQFNPLGTNLLAQSLVNFSGIHFDRAGLLPIWPEENKYESVVREKADIFEGHLSNTSKKTNTFFGNRLVTLLNDRIIPHIPNPSESTDPEVASEGSQQKWYEKAWNSTKDFVTSIFDKDEPMLYEYGGGPGSTYGIGRTSIRRFENTLTSPNFSKARLRRQGDLPVQPSIGNYLRAIGRPGTSYESPAGGGRFMNRESRIGTGDPGIPKQRNPKERDTYISQTKLGNLNYNYWNTTENYNSPLPGAFKKSDLINMLDIFKAEGNFAVPEARDLIRFRFEAMDNDHPTKSQAMIFRAFLDDLKDNYNADYNEFSYNGRGEAFYTYNSFKRSISFSFKVAAQTRQEMMPLYRKLNYLVAQTAPEYKKGRMRAGFVRLSIGSWCDRIPGFIQSINLSWQKDYPWEIAIDSGANGQDKGMLVLPHVLDVQVSFLPVHNFVPQRSIKESPFILSHENNRRLNKEQKWYKLDAAENSKDAVRLGITRLEELFPNDPPKKTEDPPIIIADEDLDIDDSYLDEEEEEFNFETQTQPDIDPNEGLPGIMGSEGF